MRSSLCVGYPVSVINRNDSVTWGGEELAAPADSVISADSVTGQAGQAVAVSRARYFSGPRCGVRRRGPWRDVRERDEGVGGGRVVAG